MIRRKSLALLISMSLFSLVTWTASAFQISWRYTDRLSLRVDPIWEFYQDNVGFDMLGYARDYATLRGGSRNSVSVFLVSNNAYGWQMKYYVPSQNRWVTRGFDMLGVAQWQGQRNYGQRRMKNWGVYFTNFNSPYSWKGAYIVRIY
jgi:hypothetical protein